MKFKTYPLPWTTVCADSTAVVAIPASNWMTATEFGKLRANMEMRGITGTYLNVGVGYQTANVENSPGGDTLLGSYHTTADMYYGTSFSDEMANTLPKQLFRFVWLVKLSQAGSLATARVGGSVDVIPPA